MPPGRSRSCGGSSPGRRGGARLAVFPELFVCGYGAGAAVAALAEPAGGPSAEAIAAIAARTGVAVLYGYPERDGRRIYNSAQLIDGSGRSIANYRKTHLYGRVGAPGVHARGHAGDGDRGRAEDRDPDLL